MTDIAGLVERLEAAAGRDREIDGAIATWEGWTFTKMKGDAQPYWRKPGRTEYWDRDTNGPPPYTNSIDDALSLVERKLGLDNETTFMYSFDFGWHASAHAPMAYTAALHLTVGTPPNMVTVDAQATTLPLAILIALLKALEQKATAP